MVDRSRPHRVLIARHILATVAVGAILGSLLSGVPALAVPAAPPPLPPPAAPKAAQVRPIPSRFTKGANDAVPAPVPTATRFPAAVHGTVAMVANGTAAKLTGSPVSVRAVADRRGRFAPPATVDVQVLDRASTQAAGIDGVLVRMTPSGSGPVRVAVDYSAYAQAYGGGYGARLRLVELPACVLTTPKVPACRTASALSTTNDTTAKSVSAPVTLTASRPLVLAASSDPGQEGGSGGNYAATTLSPSGSWTSGGSNGSFTYSYPVVLPPAATSLIPKMLLAYDSAEVDGRTAGTQAQSSWVGDGWETPQSFIEQSFVSCSDNPEGTPSPVSTSDECYTGPILTLSLNGSSTSLVWDSGAQVWKPQNEDGSVVTHVTNSGNGSGTYNTDYWTVTDRAGTVYQFGRNELPGWVSGKATTNSVDSQPVYSAHPGDPCYNAAGFTSSVCTMAYRWNLDYVKDVHGNAMAYYYLQDRNYYGRDLGATMTSYVRDSHLDHIDYGFTDGNAYGTAPDRVVFATGDRCVSGTCEPLNQTNAANWYDTPFDLICAQGATCSSQSPSYFSTVRLAAVNTQQYSTASAQYVTVDSYVLAQTFPTTGDGTAPALWLSSVTRTASGTGGGGSTTPVTFPPVAFGAIKLQNRVDTVTDGLPPFYRNRIASITTETGATISPTYSLVNPCTAPVTTTPSANTSSCFPASWTPVGYTAPFVDWFNKYVVTRVMAHDPTGGAPDNATSYVYKNNGAAWHYDDNEVVQAKYRTYGQFRGYSDVITLTGDGANDPQAKSETTYYQGMSKDNNSTVVNVTDSAGGAHEDVNQLAGRVLETSAYLGNGGPVDHSTITSYWVSGATATRNRTGLPALTANWVAPVETYARQALTDGGTTTWRYTETDTSYDATLTHATVGLPTFVYTHTVPANSSYDRCTASTYAAANTSANIVGLLGESETDSVACGGFTKGSPASVPSGLNTLTAPATVNRPAQVVSDARMFYDDPGFSTTFPQTSAPSKGDVTMVRKASTWSSGAFTYQTTARSTYDGYGRATAMYDGNGDRTGTAYTMNSVGLTTGTTVTNALNQSSTTTLDPQRALALMSTDANGIVTTRQYDAVGRASGTWLHSRATSTPADYTYAYQVSNSAVTGVTTNRLTDLSQYRATVVLYDGLLRTRQVQTTTPADPNGRLVTDTLYDSRGWVRQKEIAWAASGLPAVGPPVAPTNGTAQPVQEFYTYDGLGRTVVDTSEDQNNTVRSTVTSVYNGDRTTVIAPIGGVTQATVTDPLGRSVELDQYSAAPTLHTPTNTFTGTWWVSGGTTIATTYGFDGHGNQNTVTDANHNTWTSTYNLLEEVTSKSDPDAGTATMLYDGNGNPTQVTDSRGRVTSTTYDALDRQTASYAAPISGQSTANQLDAWVYDNSNNVAGVSNAIGHLTTETAYWGGAAYTTQIKSFNVYGQSLGETITIPSSTEGTVLGTSYLFTHTYLGPLSLPWRDTYPAAGGLPAETVTRGYTGDDLPQSLSPYTSNTSYDYWSRPLTATFASLSNPSTVTNTYDAHTGRTTDQLLRAQTGTTSPVTLNDERYTYDASGNVTTQVSTRAGAGTPTETQCYTYDAVDRLAGAWTATDNCATVPTAGNSSMVGDSLGTASAYWTTWGFDNLGNRSSQVQHSTTGGTDTSTAYTYDGNGTHQPHTLTGTASSGGASGTTSYGYDSAGDMVSRNAGPGTQALTWDDAGRLTQISSTTNGTSGFKYDAEGNLLVQKDTATTTLYLPGEQIVLNNAAGTTTGTRYFTAPGGLSVVRSGSGSAYQFVVTDGAGTPTVYLDSTGQNPTWRQSTPFGAPRGAGGTWPDNHAFLNAPADSATGLDEIGVRNYDPTTGRFISLDPVQHAGSPQQLNGYAYGADNPVSNADPSGADPCSTGGNGCVLNSDGIFAPPVPEPSCEALFCPTSGPTGSGSVPWTWSPPKGKCQGVVIDGRCLTHPVGGGTVSDCYVWPGACRGDTPTGGGWDNNHAKCHSISNFGEGDESPGNCDEKRIDAAIAAANKKAHDNTCDKRGGNVTSFGAQKYCEDPGADPGPVPASDGDQHGPNPDTPPDPAPQGETSVGVSYCVIICFGVSVSAAGISESYGLGCCRFGLTIAHTSVPASDQNDWGPSACVAYFVGPCWMHGTRSDGGGVWDGGGITFGAGFGGSVGGYSHFYTWDQAWANEKYRVRHYSPYGVVYGWLTS